MNNDNHPKNKADQNVANSAWAEIVAQWNQSTLSGNSQGDETVNPTVKPTSAGQVNLSPELLDDLELDGQLRVLGKMSDPQNQFVDTVVAQTHPESNLDQQSRPRLHVLKPSFASETSVPDGEIISALPVGDLSVSSLDVSSLDVSSLDDSSLTDSSLSDSSSPTHSRQVPRRRSAALFASLVTTFFIGCFLGSMWWFGAETETAGVPASNEIAAKPNLSKAIPDPLNDSQQNPLEFSSADDADTNGFTIGEALADQSKDQSPNEDSSTALREETARNEWNRIFDEPLEANSDLVDVNREFDSAVGSNVRELIPLDDKKNIENEIVEASSPDGSLWNSQLNWNLALQFHKNGVGSVALNGEPLQAVLLQDNAAFLLREISAQLQRRVGFLENHLGSKINGRISVGATRFDFDIISELDETVEKVEQHIAKLNIRHLSVQELMTIRAGYREGIFANRNRFHSVDLTGKNLRFYTEDEVFTVCSVLSTTEALLRNLAKERVTWEKNEEISSTETKGNICIAPTAFLLFAKSGSLHLPDPTYSGKSIARIQDLYPSELLGMLQTAPSVELFRNVNEFQKAKDYVYKNGPPEMKLRLSIDKFDRYLEEPSSLSDDMKRYFEGAKGRLVRKLRSARGRSTNPADGIAMQPLLAVLAKRKDLQGLPLAMGKECKSDTDEIHDLKQVSFAVGRTVGEFNGSLGSRDAAQNDAFRNLSIKEMVSLCMKDHAANPTSQKLKTIDQILQIDHPRLRLEMIESLRDSGTDAAVELMVKKAKFDIEPQVRIAATEALADIDAKQYRDSLLEGLDYPWHVVAEHSAEALVRLNDQDAIPSLIDMLDLPHPQFPIESNGELLQRELVGINHMRNCLLCHAPSISESDSVRGLIPHESRPLPQHYYDSQGAGVVPYAVRADITYLEQDFSVVRPVENHGPWPSEQRFDYVVQQKKLTPNEAKQVARQISQTPNRNRNAVIFALRELTGETPVDNSSYNWRNIMAARKNKVK